MNVFNLIVSALSEKSQLFEYEAANLFYALAKQKYLQQLHEFKTKQSKPLTAFAVGGTKTCNMNEKNQCHIELCMTLQMVCKGPG